MSTQFITDEDGQRVSVVLPVAEYEELLQDVSDLAAVAERREEKRVSLADVKKRLIADGLLPS
ncbi:MAG: hypothetical protein QNL51_00150 [Opitutaceae bacterium]|tara:strand:+ start:13842 stop:14030 length:189 start_codon:yes stop_codon:yes gene_type:complete